jgi:hypothetical protein
MRLGGLRQTSLRDRDAIRSERPAGLPADGSFFQGIRELPICISRVGGRGMSKPAFNRGTPQSNARVLPCRAVPHGSGGERVKCH